MGRDALLSVDSSSMGSVCTEAVRVEGDCLRGVFRFRLGGDEILTFLRTCFLAGGGGGGGGLLGDLDLGEHDVSEFSGFVRLMRVSCAGLWILGLPLFRGEHSGISISGEDSRVVVVVTVVVVCLVLLAPNST